MIRKAVLNDLNNIMIVIEDARKELKFNGLNQWNLDNGYPASSDILKDIENQILFVYEEYLTIKGIIAIIPEIDPNYDLDDFWPTNNQYISIHRMAVRTDSLKQGIASKMFVFAEQYALKHNISEIRIDTHNLNIKMKKLIEKHNYQYVGVIKLINSNYDNLRNAYYKVLY